MPAMGATWTLFFFGSLFFFFVVCLYMVFLIGLNWMF